jgi:hypothetical protein
LAASRKDKVPLAKPPDCAKVAVLPHVEPSLETWNPVGAVAVMSAVRLAPVTVTDVMLHEMAHLARLVADWSGDHDTGWHRLHNNYRHTLKGAV